jgi:hypothetical protein
MREPRFTGRSWNDLKCLRGLALFLWFSGWTDGQAIPFEAHSPCRGGRGNGRRTVSPGATRRGAHKRPGPYAYLRHIFAELPKATTLEDIEALLPGRVDREQIRIVNP